MKLYKKSILLPIASYIFITSLGKINYIENRKYNNIEKNALKTYKIMVTNRLSEEEAIKKVKLATNSKNKFSVICKEEIQKVDYFLIREYELNKGSTVTLRWYYVNIENGLVYEWDLITNNLNLIL